ncbi:MAG: hypothetical protein AAGK14_02680 [Verrucomicrobiota bacterium]
MRLPQLSSRENKLLAVLGVVAFAILSFFLFTGLWSWHASVAAQIELERANTATYAAEMQDEAKLRSRDEWLARQMRPMPAQDNANEQLLAAVQASARGDVIIQKHRFSGYEEGGHFQAMGLSFSAKSDWEPFIRFLYDLQKEASHIQFVRLEVRADPQEPSKVSAQAVVRDLYQP